MEIAAMCLNAVRYMTPNPEWTPPVGVLFVRFLVAPWLNEVEFGFADEPAKNDLQHCRSIARIRNWSAEPYFGGSLDCAKGNLDTSASAGAIVRRLAGIDDVRALMRLWDSRISIAEWLVNVSEYTPGLCAKSKDMIVRAALAPGRKGDSDV